MCIENAMAAGNIAVVIAVTSTAFVSWGAWGKPSRSLLPPYIGKLNYFRRTKAIIFGLHIVNH